MVVDRGFPPEALNNWQIGFDPLSQRVTIPVRDINSTLVGFKARAIDSERYPRYLVLGDSRDYRPYGFDPYRKSEHVFGLDRGHSSLWNHDLSSIVLVEGELNAIAMWEKHGIPSVAVAGSEFSETQRELIASNFNKVTIYFDDDVYDKEGVIRDINPGRRGAVRVASALQSFINVAVVLCAPGDAAELSTEQVKELIDGARPAMELAIDGELDLVLTT